MVVQARLSRMVSNVESMGAADAELARILVAENNQGDLGAHSRSHSQAGATYFKRPPVDTFVTVDGVLARKCPEAATAGTLPPARAASTLVFYVYNAVDEEQMGNFDFFLKFGLSANDTVTYRIIITSGGAVKPPLAMPELPPSAKYISTTACTGTWGALGAIEEQVDATKFPFVVVVDSSVRGPFLPPYAAGVMHWTEAFTSRLTKSVKMVGSAISCEGAPRAGHAALEWRRNPYVLPYAWAADADGWAVLAADPNVFRCFQSPWDARYYSDVGAGLAMLRAGYNLDSLLMRYQGVDWWALNNWDCNGRVRPDGEMQYDGASITPYETMFVPMDAGKVEAKWTYIRTALKYQEWMQAQANKAMDVNTNALSADPWTSRAEDLVAMNARGPGCFDFRFYTENNPDLAGKAGSPLELWEHWLLLGQFQGRTHRFSCPVQMGTTYRIAYLRARGGSCFDHNYYLRHNPDLRAAGMTSSSELYGHYTYFGQFEERAVKFVCPDTWHNLAGGYETVAVGSEAEVKASLQEFAAGTLEARNLVHVSKHQVEARGR